MDFRVQIRDNKKQLWLKPQEIENGIQFALENNINSLFLWDNSEYDTVTLDFSWLKELPKIYSLDIMLKLSKQSNINGIYELKELKKLVYFEYNNLPLNHYKLKSLEYLYTHYSEIHKTNECKFEVLENLKTLKLWHIKKEQNCVFLGNLKNLELLELVWSGTLKTLEGIEKFKNLEKILLENLSKLEDISAAFGLAKLDVLFAKNCKKINEEGKKIIKEKEEKILEYRNKK
jgi:hypothetical protein